jgi:hypothetical protein
MKRLWTHSDGHLRIGSVSVVLFALMLVVAGLAMKMSRPVDEALVQVKHVFRVEKDAAHKIVEEKIVEETSSQAEQSVPPEQSPPEVGETMAVREAAPVASLMHDEHKQDEGESEASLPQEPLASGGSILEPVLDAKARLDTDPGDEQEAVETMTFESAEVAQPVVVEESDPFHNLRQNTEIKKSDDQQPAAVVVSPEQYRETFKAWRTTDLKMDDEATRPGLLVENLREVYPLLQMKPVALVGNVAYDLEDGSRLAKRSLDRYTATIFQVANPWDDWEAALRRIGLRPDDAIEVRYYMHSYVHNGIYGRCVQAIDWGKARGLLPDDVKIAEIEVRGRAYIVRQQGGGQFGVFVPRQLRLLDGQIVTVDPAALQESTDVALLQAAKIL